MEEYTKESMINFFNKSKQLFIDTGKDDLLFDTRYLRICGYLDAMLHCGVIGINEYSEEILELSKIRWQD